MTSAGYQRKLDLAPTASVDKVALNNKVVLMRAIVRRSKLHIINALVKRVHKLREKKGTEAQKSQNKGKADRMLEDIKIIKVLKPDYVSKYALGTTETFGELAAKPDTTAGMRALARLAAHNFIKQEVVKFRREHDDWKDLAAYLMTKHTSREFKKKKTKEKMKKIETNVKASETLVQKYLGEKLDGRNDLDNADYDIDYDNNGEDYIKKEVVVDIKSEVVDDIKSEVVDDIKSEEVDDIKGSVKDSVYNDVTKRKKGESSRITSVNQSFSKLQNKDVQKLTEKERLKSSVLTKIKRENNSDSGNDIKNDFPRSVGDGNESNDFDHDADNSDDLNDEGDDESSDEESIENEDATDNDSDDSTAQNSDKTFKHKANHLETEKDKIMSKESIAKKSKHLTQIPRSDDFNWKTEKKRSVKEKVEGEMIVRKLDLEKDFVDNEIPKVLLSSEKLVKRKKKTKDLFFETGEGDESESPIKEESEFNDKDDNENADKEATDSKSGGHFERSIQPTLTSFTTCFVGSLKSSDMMACKESQYRSNEDWKKIRHENKEQKMGRGANSSFSRGRGNGPEYRGRGSPNKFTSQRGRGFSGGPRGRGFSDGTRGRGFSGGPRGRGFSDGPQGRGFSQNRGRGFQGRGRGHDFDRPGREDFRKQGNSPAESKQQGSLHPSWEASKKRKQEQNSVFKAFEGKKIKFD